MEKITLGNSDKQNLLLEYYFDLSNFMRKYALVFFLLIILSQALSAQNKTEDITFSTKNEALNNALNIYSSAIGDNSMIFTGGYYIESNAGIDGHPFYINNFWNTGYIVYQGQRYDSVEIRYDIYRDLVLIKYIDHLGQVWPVQIQRAKIKEFNIMGHRFIRMQEDSLSILKPGFFDLLYDGTKASVLAKRRKEIGKTQNVDNLVRKYYTNDIWYIKYDQNYYVVKGKKSLLEVLSDRRDEVKTYLKKNKARLKRDQERQFIEAVRYYNSIVNNVGS
jgi:hypothetical protein